MLLLMVMSRSPVVIAVLAFASVVSAAPIVDVPLIAGKSPDAVAKVLERPTRVVMDKEGPRMSIRMVKWMSSSPLASQI